MYKVNNLRDEILVTGIRSGICPQLIDNNVSGTVAQNRLTKLKCKIKMQIMSEIFYQSNSLKWYSRYIFNKNKMQSLEIVLVDKNLENNKASTVH